MHDRKNIGKLILDPAQTPKPKPATPAKGKSKDKKQASEEKNGEKDKKVGCYVNLMSQCFKDWQFLFLD